MVRAYDDFIQVPRDPLNTDNLTGRQLYDTLIAPAAALMPKNAKVIIVPDGPLYALNFETLPVTGGKPRYWIEDVTVTVTPSLDLLVPDRGSRNPTPPSLLLIGNPVSPVPSQYPELEFAAQEIEGIRKDLPSFRQKVWEREQAEPAVYARSMPAEFGYIHFVAHGVANSEEPLESAVILSRSNNGSEYKLRARDVLGMPLHATLVTISACRSAGARAYAGEGLVGFPWAFLEAGAQNVIAGLWDVNDRSTADLMSRLYARIAHGADPATSLREAKLAVIHSGGAWQKPYYWGPFELFTRQSQ
jgi:CHAT domain-containing protein